MELSDLQELRSFESDVRQLLKSYQKQSTELSDLRNLLLSKDEEIERLQSEIRAVNRAYSNLKLARMIEVSDADLHNGKLRITRLVREVNKCIRLLSAEMGDIGDTDVASSSDITSSESTFTASEDIISTDEQPKEPSIESTQASVVPVAQEPATVNSDVVKSDEAIQKTSEDDAATVSLSENTDDELSTTKKESSSSVPTKDNLIQTSDSPVSCPTPKTSKRKKGAAKAEKSQESTTSPSTDSKVLPTEPLTLDLDTPSTPEMKELNLWNDNGMLPLFTTDEDKDEKSHK